MELDEAMVGRAWIAPSWRTPWASLGRPSIGGTPRGGQGRPRPASAAGEPLRAPNRAEGKIEVSRPGDRDLAALCILRSRLNVFDSVAVAEAAERLFQQ
jgi:hypothetical protein